MARDDDWRDMLPFDHSAEVMVQLNSDTTAPMQGRISYASPAGVSLSDVRTLDGEQVSDLVFLPWANILYIAPFERESEGA